jgi:hypothetical protein
MCIAKKQFLHFEESFLNFIASDIEKKKGYTDVMNIGSTYLPDGPLWFG